METANDKGRGPCLSLKRLDCRPGLIGDQEPLSCLESANL